jgi:methyl-accepting chemotaxis protein
MATMCFAMWLQDEAVSNNRHLILILAGVIAIAVVGMAIVLLAIAVKAVKAIEEFGEATQEFKAKLLPLLDEVTAFSKSGREMLQDSAPKVKMITDNMLKVSETLAETSKIARSAAAQIDTTLTDANLRTQRQVARVDSMITAALTTTTEVAEAVANGIRVPVQKAVAMAGQAKLLVEGLLSRFRARSAAAAPDPTEYDENQDQA